MYVIYLTVSKWTVASVFILTQSTTANVIQIFIRLLFIY